jgi:serine/threonine protein phosphatase PrpC
MSRALGDFCYKNNPKLSIEDQIISPIPDVIKTSRIEICYIIMGCDGIWETKSNEEMCRWFQKSMQGKNASLRTVIELLFN